MTTTYEVWDLDSANQIAELESEDEVDAFLTNMLRENGAASVEPLAVSAVEHDESGVQGQRLVIEGRAFISELAKVLADHLERHRPPPLVEVVRAWLHEMGWDETTLNDPAARFNFVYRVSGDDTVNVVEPLRRPDLVVIASRLVVPEEMQPQIDSLSTTEKIRLRRDIIVEMLRLGVELELDPDTLGWISMKALCRRDGLTKDLFWQRVFLIVRALHLTRMVVIQALEAAGGAVEDEAALPVPEPAVNTGSERSAQVSAWGGLRLGVASIGALGLNGHSLSVTR